MAARGTGSRSGSELAVITRRTLTVGTVALAAGARTAPALGAARVETVAALDKPRLPFAAEALAPRLSAETIRAHFAGHHMGYYNQVLNLNNLAGQTLPDIIRNSQHAPALAPLHAAACQLFNHNVYWRSLQASDPETPPPILARIIERDFGGLAQLHEAFLQAASRHPGTGWLWLLSDREGRLQVRALSDAESPLVMGAHPLLAIDLWEHAYYLDYRHRRTAYLSATLDLLNWPFAQAMLLGTQKGQLV